MRSGPSENASLVRPLNSPSATQRSCSARPKHVSFFLVTGVLPAGDKRAFRTTRMTLTDSEVMCRGDLAPGVTVADVTRNRPELADDAPVGVAVTIVTTP